MIAKCSHRLRHWSAAVILGMTAVVGIARADDAPKPPAEQPAEPRRGPGVMLKRLAENLGKLDLSAEQQEKTKALIADVRQQLQKLVEDNPDSDRLALAKKAREIVGQTRGKLAEILTPEQQEKLRDLMQQPPPGDPPAVTPPPVESPKPPSDAKPKDAPPVMNPTDPMDRKAATKKPDAPAASPTGAMVEPGQPAPDFTLKALNDHPTPLSSMKGRVVVLVFGSYSTPSFRQRIPALEKLAKDYSTRANFFVVYTREAHALGEWEVARNKDENISIEQPKTDADRRGLAGQAVSTLKITLPVLVDGMDDAVAKAYGLTPNGAVVIGRDGTVIARQHWFEPIGLRQQIDTAVAIPNGKE